MKTIDKLVFNKIKNRVSVAPVQDGEEPYNNMGIKLIKNPVLDDGYKRLTEAQKIVSDNCYQAMIEIAELSLPEGVEFDVEYSTYFRKIEKDGEYVSGNNVSVQFVKPIILNEGQPDEEIIREVDTGNLLEYASQSAQHQSIKDRIDTFGLLCTQLLNS